MSWWVSLEDRTGEPRVVAVAPHREGGTYVLGGTAGASLNITYNYGVHYHRLLPGGLEAYLNERQAADATEVLEQAVNALGTDRADDYWAPTPGNAGFALSILLSWAKQHPSAVFRVS